jgi:hypothetical protein
MSVKLVGASQLVGFALASAPLEPTRECPGSPLKALDRTLD